MDQNKSKSKMSNKKFKRIWSTTLVAVLIIALALNVALNIFSGHVDLYLGRGDIVVTKAEGTENWDSTYYTSDYDSDEALQEAANNMVEKIEGEGIVLMKNNGVLPLNASSNVTVLGRDAADPVYGGSGSGAVDLSSVIDFKTGLEQAGFNVNNTVFDLLVSYASYKEEPNTMGGMDRKYDHPKANIVMDKPEESQYSIGEMPVSEYTDSAKATFAEYNDAAVIMLGRGGGEGGDLARDMTGWDDHYEPGQHQLELNYDEKQLIKMAEENFDNVVVLINASTPMELGVLENDENIDAILWVGSPGQTGFNAVGDVLSGAITPSGHTADIYPSDFTKDPTFVNFGNYQYSNISADNAMGDGFFVQYEEGIYIGYKYYETAAVEGFINYDDAVVYPFGYGLSYTNFAWEVEDQRLGDVDGTIDVDVKVTNTGDTYAGKDTVQLYYSAPYTKGGIEKSSIILGDFAKTDLLAPGESQVVTLSLAVEDMASYDYKDNKAYVLDQGDYTITLQTDSHNIKENIAPINYNVSSTIVYNGENHRQSDKTAVTNQFDDISALFKDEAQEGYVRNFSRADFAGTFPTAPTEADFVASDAIIEGFAPYVTADHADPNAVAPTFNASNGLSLIDLRGKDYNDPAWNHLLDQITPEEMITVITNSAYNTAEMPSVNKPATVDLDGPAGISAFMGDTHGTAYPSEVVIASTFSKDIARQMGEMIGNESLHLGVNGWYAPAMNIHRSQFAGRNFEYYSEDPVLSGKIASEVVSGAAEKGVYSFIKHFALNDQETNRVNNGVATWANEQDIRETYLKPFEIVVKTATQTLKYISDDQGTVSEKEMPGTTAVMSSFNRIGSTWAGGSSALLQNVLRDEWGFRGAVISDFNLYDYMYANQGIHNGTDFYISFSSMKSFEDTTNPSVLNDFRNSAHNLLYTVANSNAMNNIVPGTTISYTMAPWRKVLYIADVVIALFLICGFAFMVNRIKKNKEA